MNHFFFPSLLLFLFSCSSQKAVVDLSEVDEVDAEWQLVFSLAAADAVAGDDVGFSLVWVDASGSEADVESFELEYVGGDEAEHDEDSLLVTRAGPNTFAASASDPTGSEQTATADIDVVPGPAAALSIVLDSDVAPAGEPVAAEVTAADEYGNSVDTADAVWEVSDGVALEDSTLTATVVGDYSVNVSIDEAADSADWTVVAGPAAVVDLVVESEGIEVGDSADFTVETVDAYGNPASDPVTVTVGEGAEVLDDEIEFNAEGVFVCTATVDGTEITDSETVTVDSSGPVLVVENPERGDWMDVGRVTVSGTVSDAVTGVSSLTVQEEVVSVEEDGSFEQVVELDFGITIIETTAADADFDE